MRMMIFIFDGFEKNIEKQQPATRTENWNKFSNIFCQCFFWRLAGSIENDDFWEKLNGIEHWPCTFCFSGYFIFHHPTNHGWETNFFLFVSVNEKSSCWCIRHQKYIWQWNEMVRKIINSFGNKKQLKNKMSDGGQFFCHISSQ